MSKKKVQEENVTYDIIPLRKPVLIAVPHRDLDQTIETVQGKATSVQQLYQDFVLGKLDVNQLGGQGSYDEDNDYSVDPFNAFGVTMEQVTDISDSGSTAKSEVLREQEKQAKAKAVEAEEEMEKRVRAKIEKELAERGEGTIK